MALTWGRTLLTAELLSLFGPRGAPDVGPRPPVCPVLWVPAWLRPCCEFGFCCHLCPPLLRRLAWAEEVCRRGAGSPTPAASGGAGCRGPGSTGLRAGRQRLWARERTARTCLCGAPLPRRPGVSCWKQRAWTQQGPSGRGRVLTGARPRRAGFGTSPPPGRTDPGGRAEDSGPGGASAPLGVIYAGG